MIIRGEYLQTRDAAIAANFPEHQDEIVRRTMLGRLVEELKKNNYVLPVKTEEEHVTKFTIGMFCLNYEDFNSLLHRLQASDIPEDLKDLFKKFI